jgi:hypothetical protein
MQNGIISIIRDLFGVESCKKKKLKGKISGQCPLIEEVQGPQRKKAQGPQRNLIIPVPTICNSKNLCFKFQHTFGRL